MPDRGLGHAAQVLLADADLGERGRKADLAAERVHALHRVAAHQGRELGDLGAGRPAS